MPTVSAVIPAYNAERTLEQALDSVDSQSHRDVETIVVDDGSRTHGGVAESRHGVICIRKANRGVSAARNSGIERASGDFIAFLDADDCSATGQARAATGSAGLPSVRRSVVHRSHSYRRRPECVGYTPARSYPDYCEALLLYSQIASLLSSIVAGATWSTRLEASTRRSASAPIGTSRSVLQPDDYLRSGRRPARRLPKFSRQHERRHLAARRNTFAVLDKFFSQAPDEYVRLRRRCYSNHWMIVSGSYLHAGQTRAALRSSSTGQDRSS